jgi:hypothetical protein
MRILRVGGCSLVMALAAFSFAAAQTMEDDDPNDQRYWGFSSNYAQIQNLEQVQNNLSTIEGVEIKVSSVTVYFHLKEEETKPAKLIKEVTIPLKN